MTMPSKEAKSTLPPPLPQASATESPSEHPQPTSPNDKRSKRKQGMLWGFTLLLFILAGAWLSLWIFYLQYYESTDDAYASGSMVNLNASITGSVTAFYADDTDLVIEGQLLVELDPTYYQVAYDKAFADLATQVLQLRQLVDEKLVNQANVAIKRTQLSKARFDYENRSQLAQSKAISNEDFIHARDDLTVAENELKKAESQLKASEDILGTTPIKNHPLLDNKKALVREAYYNLQHTKIYAPITGYVAKRAVNVGQSVARTTELMAIIPTDYVWVDANFKETQLKYMRIGQPASVWFDLYGSAVKYQGKVLGIASGSGSIFSLIPPQNATGNWIKIVQRLPVRISLDPEVVKQYPVRLGISAEVDVDITEQDLPMLTQIPPVKAVSTTSVYDIHIDEVNQLIDDVIQMHLAPKEPSQSERT